MRNESLLELNHEDQPAAPEVTQATVFAARKEILEIHMAPVVEEYMVQLTMATRAPQNYGEDLANWLDYGASPRGTISLDICARANAWLMDRNFVSPDDVQAVFHDVFRHRIIISFEAEAAGIDADTVLDTLMARVAVG